MVHQLINGDEVLHDLLFCGVTYAGIIRVIFDDFDTDVLELIQKVIPAWCLTPDVAVVTASISD